MSVLVVIDQAEELLTLAGEQERLAFLGLLRAALQSDPRLWVVVTLRSEFLTGFLTTDFAPLFRNPAAIGSLDRTALFEVIEKPAERAGLTFGSGVVNGLVDDAGSGDALPLLAYTLQALYLRAAQNGTITAEDYQQLGGVTGTLARQADRVTAELHASDADAPVLATLLKFVTLDEAEPTRRRVSRSMLNDAECSVVDTFIAARLLTSDTDGEDAVIQVAHEALFRHWVPLRQAIEAAADDLRQRAELERWAWDWTRSGHQDAYLLRDERLRIAQQWADAHGDLAAELPLINEFLDRSARSDRASLERLSEAVAKQALAAVEFDPEHSLLLALAAIEECARTPLAHRALLTALAAFRVRSILHGHEDVVVGVAWSPDGRRLATVSGDRTARIWDAANGTELAVLRGHQDGVWGIGWSPDGQRIATASGDQTAQVWDIDTGGKGAILRGHEAWVEGVAWAPDSQRVATVSSDRTARIWDAANGTELAVLRGHQDGVWGIGWSPDGQRIATASRDRTARVWDVESGTELAVLRGHQDWVWDVDWAPDGQHVATASDDHTARIWDAANGSELVVLEGHEAANRDVVWSPNGQRLATASSDRSVRIWEAKTHTQLAIARIHQRTLSSIAWSPDSKRIATASFDGIARIWYADSGAQLAVLHGHQDGIWGIAWSPDGQRIATASSDRTARIWYADSGIQLAVLHGHQDWVTDVTWSPDGRQLATVSRDRTVRVWDAINGTDSAS